jgi:hypothetical protein
MTSKELASLTAVETDGLNRAMRPEESGKIVWLNGKVLNRSVKAPLSFCVRAHVPQSDTLSDKALQPLLISKRRHCANKLAHNSPERIARLRVVLTACQRLCAWKSAQNEHSRIWFGDCAETGRIHSDFAVILGTKRPVRFMYSRYLSPKRATKFSSSVRVRIIRRPNTTAPALNKNQFATISETATTTNAAES